MEPKMTEQIDLFPKEEIKGYSLESMTLDELRAEFSKRVTNYCPPSMIKEQLIEALGSPQEFLRKQREDDHEGDPYFVRKIV